MKIKFTNINDFLGELLSDKDKIERNILRVNYLIEPSITTRNFSYLYVMSQAIIGGNIVEVKFLCGGINDCTDGEEDKSNEKPERVANRVRKEIEAFGIDLGLDIRGGTIEPYFVETA